MADQRTMFQLLQAPTEGYKDAIVVPAITADNFELKHGLLTLVHNKQFFGHDKEDLHAHRFDGSFSEAWDRFKDLLRACPYHGFSELHQLDTFYNALNSKDQDLLNSAAGVSTNTSTSGISPDVAELKDMVKALLLDKKGQNQSPAPVKAVDESCVTCGAYQAPTYQALAPQTQGVSKEDFSSYVKDNDAVMRKMQTQGQNMQNQITNLTDLITNFVNSNSASTLSSGTLPSNITANSRCDLKAITTRSETTKDIVNPTNNESTKDVQPQVVQSESLILTSDPITSPISEPVIALVNASKHNLKSSIPYPSRRDDGRTHEKANNQIEKFYQIFKDMSFKISYADALILMPKFASTLKALIGNKEKFIEMARTLLNEHCSVVFLKKLSEKLGDPGKFLIPCDFPSKAKCLALADLGASINLMPFSVWRILSLPDLTPTCITLELADHLISRSVGVAKDVYVKVDQTSRNSANYSDMTAKRIDVIDMACEEYSQEVLEVDAFLAIEDDPTSPEFYQPYLDPEGDILLLEAFLNDDTSLPPPPNQGNYVPEVRKELKIYEAKSDKSLVDEPPEEKTALITVLKSHKRAIAWKLSDIKGIDPEFCTYKILMEEDFEPTVQHQRRVNPKIHDVIKQKVIKLLKAGLIYLISDSPWVSPVHCVPKKGGFTVVENEYNKLIPTHLVMGWRVCINYRKLYEATRKDHFPLSFMDQMLDRLAGNQYYCFLDGNCFQSCLSHLERMLKRCEDTNLCINWEKSHFMVKEGIVLGHKISKQGIEVDKAKVDVITKLPYPTTIKECVEAFQTLKRKLTEAPILIAPDWDMPFELMCDASDFAIRAVLGQCQDKHFRPIHYARAENLAADHLFRLENPYQNVLDPKEINESFPLETLNLKSKFFKDVKHYFWDDPFLFKIILIKSSEGVYLARKLLKSSRLATMDPQEVMQKYGVTHRLATPYHPQTSGQVEVSNRGLKRILERAVGENRASRLDKLDDALWHKGYLRLEAAKGDSRWDALVISPRDGYFDPMEFYSAPSSEPRVGDHMKAQINELNELRDQAYKNSLIYKEKTKRLHDSKIKNRVFNIGDRVLLFNSRLKIFSDKLKSSWSGAFTVSQVYPYGTVELSQPDGPNFKVNGHRLKHYFGEDVPKVVVPDLQTFSKDH
uniref:Reverse transcriptase domain-containing protein n=1 Tax=Tanacetum cinerariifolium TaxID=118510 RepID=A0A6L2N9Q5_TANCI|nr:reverse transcriptase domain-containing protein [Tanacetum cinerariifolium]